MKRTFLAMACAAVISLTGCSIMWDSQQLSSAAGKALTAASISDAQIIQLCQNTAAKMDASANIDNGDYQKRLAKVLSGVKTVGDRPLNFKVYKTNQVNAFALADGSIRVYSGLMDVMDDAELTAIIGHEIGHVAHGDSKKAMKKAYLTSAARDLVGAAGTVGAISSAVLGDISESFANAQFSQSQEYKADDYGFEFSVARGYSPYSMSNALDKLVGLSQGSQASAVAQMFSSHPDSEARAKKMKLKAVQYAGTKSGK